MTDLRYSLLVGCVALLAATSAARAQEDDFSGRWDTNMGEMRMQQAGDHIVGSYELKGGRVEGHVDGNTLRGIWTQYSADHRCLEPRMGSDYWGRFQLHLNRDGDAFYGHWSYCDNERGTGGNWTGQRRHLRRYPGRF